MNIKRAFEIVFELANDGALDEDDIMYDASLEEAFEEQQEALTEAMLYIERQWNQEASTEAKAYIREKLNE